MQKTVENIGLIVLAAGASKRLGRSKQLLRFQGETLLKRSIKNALDSDCRLVIVVLGANAETLRLEIEEFDVEIAENLDWENGMGTSIKIGLEKLLEMQPDISGAILTVCDQPFVSANLINRLVKNFLENNVPVVACSYDNTIGVPALFSRELFSELADLDSEGGAKKIIYKYKENMIEIPFQSGMTDIDTEDDYLKLLNSGEQRF
jgi:molybdenum cofactor cytidylyltransferase